MAELWDYKDDDGNVYEGLTITEALRLYETDFEKKRQNKEQELRQGAQSAIDRTKQQIQQKQGYNQVADTMSGLKVNMPEGGQQPAKPSNLEQIQRLGMQQAGSAPMTMLNRNDPQPQARQLGQQLNDIGRSSQMNDEDIYSQNQLTDKYSEVPEVQNFLQTQRDLASQEAAAADNENTKKQMIGLAQELKSNPQYNTLATVLETIAKSGDVEKYKDILKNVGSSGEADVDFEYDTRKEAQKQKGDINLELLKQRDLKENMFENARQQQAALRAAEFDAKEKDMLQSVEEGKLLLSDLVNTFKNSGFGGIDDMIGEGTAKIPLVGKYAAGKNKQYQNQKRLAAETWLRAATGAAAPDHEVATYTNFLPNESDPPEIADKKIENFFNKIAAKVKARAKIFDVEGAALEKRGMIDLANIKYEQAELVRQMIAEGRNAIPKIKGDDSNVDSFADDDGNAILERNKVTEIKSDDDYNKLKSGQKYRAPDGSVRTKK